MSFETYRIISVVAKAEEQELPPAYIAAQLALDFSDLNILKSELIRSFTVAMEQLNNGYNTKCALLCAEAMIKFFELTSKG